MRHTQFVLPKIALEFLSIAPNEKKCKRAVRAFHVWMVKWKLNFQLLKPAHIESFLSCPQGKRIGAEAKADYRVCLAKYLIWRHEKTPLRFDPHFFLGPKRIVLPPLASRFARMLEPTYKKSTINGYRVSLHRFHNWLDEHRLDLKQLKRRHLSNWLLELNDDGLSPRTRSHHVIYVRVYLRWLYEQGIVKSYPDDLLRNSDIPKQPKYLPRPISPAADRQLQERLARSNDRYDQGLLLMRLTGLRIGELMSLKRNCIRRDHLGHCFLKVPLGKLNNERLVPLDDRALATIERLQGKNERSVQKTFLIETNTGTKTFYTKYMLALKKAAQGLETNGAMVTHRLRHTYATTLLSAGMSIVSIMKLLGHNDYQMTLRYTAITQETVGKEYFAALAELEKTYRKNLTTADLSETDPIEILAHLIRLINKNGADDPKNKHVLFNLARRLTKIKHDLESLAMHSQSKYQLIPSRR